MLQSKFPKWLDITDWSSVTLDKVQFCYEQATLCYADQLDGYRGIKKRCEMLFGLSITLMLALIPALATVISGNLSPVLLTPISIMLSTLTLVIYIVWQHLSAFKLKSQGQNPRKLLTKEYFEGQTVQNIIFAETIAIQQKIDDLEEVKQVIAKDLGKGLKIFAISPLLALTGLLVHHLIF